VIKRRTNRIKLVMGNYYIWGREKGKNSCAMESVIAGRK